MALDKLNTVFTANATLAIGDVIARVDPSGGDFTITLPAASGSSGQVVVIKNTTSSGNLITVSPAGGDTINGQASATLTGALFCWQIVSDGTSNWMVVG